MTNNNYLKEGSYNMICDRCGRKYKREQVRKEWTGLMTCFNCWDPKHSWNLPLPIPVDALPVPDARPRPNPVFTEANGESMSIWGQTYQTSNGLISDPLWDQWDEVIGGEDQLPYTPENFPLR